MSEGRVDPFCLATCGREDFLLPKARKEQTAEQVELLTEKLRKAKVALPTDYRGLTVTQLQELRGKLRTGDVEYRVVKNTLARRAADAAGVADLKAELEGPVAIAFGYDDLSLPSRLINEWVRTTRLKLDVKGGLVEGRVFSPNQVKQLADLPSRETLIAQLAGAIQSPIAQLAGALQMPLSMLAGALESYQKKLEAA